MSFVIVFVRTAIACRARPISDSVETGAELKAYMLVSKGYGNEQLTHEEELLSGLFSLFDVVAERAPKIENDME